MAGTKNFFALLDDDETDDPQMLVTKFFENEKLSSKKVDKTPSVTDSKISAPAAPSSPPPSAATRGRGNSSRGRGNFRGNRDGAIPSNGVQQSEGDGALNEKEPRHLDGGRGRDRGKGRGFHHHGDERRHRREFDRHSGTGQGFEMKRHGAGAANWGVEGEIVNEANAEVEVEDSAVETEIEKVAEDSVKVEPEDESKAVVEGEEPKEAEEVKEEVKEEEKEEEKLMTLQEFEKLREEKRKALDAKKAALRVVDHDKDFDDMQKVSKAAEEELVLFKLGREKEKGSKKKGDEEERPKTVNLNEFLKPADGESINYRRGGRNERGGRGERRGGRGGRGGRFGRRDQGYNSAPINTEDTAQFPTLG